MSTLPERRTGPMNALYFASFPRLLSLIGRPPRNSLKAGIMKSCETLSFTLNWSRNKVEGLAETLAPECSRTDFANRSPSHVALIQICLVIRKPMESRKATIGWMWLVMRLRHPRSSGDGHACPWKSPTFPKTIPVEGRIFTVSGRRGSSVPSWFPSTIWMSGTFLFMVSKKFGMSRHSSISTFAIASFTSPRKSKRVGLHFLIS